MAVVAKWWEAWSPENVTIADETPDEAWKACVLQGVYFGDSEYNGKLGIRISSIFVIFFTSLAVTLVPLLAKRWNVPKLYYVIAKMFGSGVIVATAFVHLMDPAYTALGPNSCVGMSGEWASYSWCAAIIMCGALLTFLVDVYCSAFVARKYSNYSSDGSKVEVASATDDPRVTQQSGRKTGNVSSQALINDARSNTENAEQLTGQNYASDDDLVFRSQFYGFLILECGILLHSVMIGLSLGTTANIEALYAAIAFHQAFEGLGIGARLSAIPFPHKLRWIPYALCFAYAITTPVAIAIGLGVHATYRENGYTSLVVAGILDSFAAGVLIYTGFVELIARDFIFNETVKSLSELNIEMVSFLAGAGIMAVIGKWA